MISNFKQVIDFNKSFGIFISDIEIPNIFDTNSKLVLYRYSLIDEEVKELNDAFEQKNFVEVIDALSDILYVVYGAGTSFGVDLDERYRLYMNSDLNKRFNTNVTNYENTKSYLINNLDIKLPVNITNIFENKLYDFIDNTIKRMLGIINKLVNALNISIITKDFDELKTSLTKLLYYTYCLGCLMGIDLDKSYNIVHKSNMSKLCIDETEAKKTVDWYKINEDRYDTPNYRKSYNGQKWVVFNESTGKILKSINYKPANFNSMYK